MENRGLQISISEEVNTDPVNSKCYSTLRPCLLPRSIQVNSWVNSTHPRVDLSPSQQQGSSWSWPRDGGKGLNKYHSVAKSISSSSVHSPLPELPSPAKFIAIKLSLVDYLQPHHHQQATNLFEHTPVRAIPCRRRSPCPCFCPPYGR